MPDAVKVRRGMSAKRLIRDCDDTLLEVAGMRLGGSEAVIKRLDCGCETISSGNDGIWTISIEKRSSHPQIEIYCKGSDFGEAYTMETMYVWQLAAALLLDFSGLGGKDGQENTHEHFRNKLSRCAKGNGDLLGTTDTDDVFVYAINSLFAASVLAKRHSHDPWSPKQEIYDMIQMEMYEAGRVIPGRLHTKDIMAHAQRDNMLHRLVEEGSPPHLLAEFDSALMQPIRDNIGYHYALSGPNVSVQVMAFSEMLVGKLLAKEIIISGKTSRLLENPYALIRNMPGDGE
jgi:hypothetical protein